MPRSPVSIDTTSHHAWLVDKGLAGAPVPELLDDFCQRLLAAGIPLTRGYLSTAALHPLMWATGFRWHSSGTVEAVDIAYGYEREAAWLSSPFRHMVDTQTHRLRRRLAGEGVVLDYPVLGELRDAGLTDWLALFYTYGWPLRHGQVTELGVIFS